MTAAPLVMPDDLGTYLGVTVDLDRAELILGLAQRLCETVVSPLPIGAEAVILDVAARAWTNPTNVQSESTGPFSATYGQVAGGLWLTRSNRAALRQLAGGGGVFTIDTLPAAAGQSLPWWDAGGAVFDDSGSFWW